MSSITVNVNTNNVKVDEVKTTPVTMDDSIRAAAKRRFEEEEAAKLREAAAALNKDKAREESIKSIALEEQIKARVQEEQIRRMAEKAVFEAEAKKVALAKEAAIAAEIERLRNRTKQEILEDTINDLKQELSTLKAKSCESCPHRFSNVTCRNSCS